MRFSYFLTFFLGQFSHFLTFFEGDEPAVHQPELGRLDEAGLVLPTFFIFFNFLFSYNVLPTGRLELPTLSLSLHLLVPL